MIQSIVNKNYTFCQLRDKDIQWSNEQIEVPKIKRDNESNKQLIYSTYEKDELLNDFHKSKWEELEKIVEKDLEDYSVVMREGYLLENKDISVLNRYLEEPVPLENEKVIDKEAFPKKRERIEKEYDSMYYYAMKTDGPISYDDLYKWSFGGDIPLAAQEISDEEISHLLRMNQLVDDPHNRNAAKKLAVLQIDISPKSISKMRNLDQVVQDMKMSGTGNYQINMYQNIIKDGGIIYTQRKVQGILDDLGKINQEIIKIAQNKYDIITIQNLREMLYKNTSKVLNNEEVISKEQEVTSKEQEAKIKEINYQINEIRAKLNVETACKISEKMPLQSSELSKVAEELKVIHEETIDEVLEEVDLSAEVENKSMLDKTMEAVVVLGRQKALAVEMYVKDEEITLEQIHLAGKAYEEQALEPESRFKEDITKVESQIRSFLEGKDIPPTEEVIDAARALILNEIELTQENLQEVAPIVDKMTTLVEELTPDKAATLIKEGINPYKASVNKLVDWIETEKFKELGDYVGEVIGALEEKNKLSSEEKEILSNLYKALKQSSLEDKTSLERLVRIVEKNNVEQIDEFIEKINKQVSLIKSDTDLNQVAKNILEMSKENKITEFQKENIVALYQILNKLEKNKFEVAGYLYKNNLPITVERVEEALKYVQQDSVIERRIDDEFGALERLEGIAKIRQEVFEQGSIEQQKIIKMIKNIEELELASQIEQANQNQKLAGKKLYTYVKKLVQQEIIQYKSTDILPNSFLEKLEVLKKVDSNILRFMEKAQIPLTLSNIYWIKKFNDEPDLYEKLCRQYNLKKGSFPKSFEEIEEDIRADIESTQENKQQAMIEGDIIQYKGYKQLEEVMGLQKKLAQKEAFYQIPFVIDGQQKVVQLYIKENNKNKGKDNEKINMVISYATAQLGRVGAYVTIDKKQIKYEAFGESNQVKEQLEKHSDVLKNLIQEMGYQLIGEAYSSTKEKITPINPIPKRIKSSEFEVIA